MSGGENTDTDHEDDMELPPTTQKKVNIASKTSK